MSTLRTPNLSTNSYFTLIGNKDKAQLAVDGFLVTFNDLKAAGFGLKKSKAKGGLEICAKCSPDQKTRVWYEVEISCNKVRGPIWICSNCSNVYFHERRGMDIWRNLLKTLQPESVVSENSKNGEGNYKLYLPSKEYVESSIKAISSIGDHIDIDTLLDFIEKKAKNDGLLLQDNWRYITEENLKIWSRKRSHV